jgi:hypothetical protein
MENPNAFIGKTTQPTAEEVIAVMGPTAAVWKELIDWFAEQNDRRPGVEVLLAKSRLVGPPQSQKEKYHLSSLLAKAAFALRSSSATRRLLLRGKPISRKAHSNCSMKRYATRKGQAFDSQSSRQRIWPRFASWPSSNWQTDLALSH